MLVYRLSIFLKNVREMAFPKLLSCEGIRRIGVYFPAFVAYLEMKMGSPQMIQDRDRVLPEVAGRLFKNREINKL